MTDKDTAPTRDETSEALYQVWKSPRMHTNGSGDAQRANFDAALDIAAAHIKDPS